MVARHSPPCISARRGIRSTPQFIHTCLHRTTPINSVPLTIISRSSVIVGDCDTSSCIPPAIKLVKDSIVSVTETVIGAVSGIIFVLQTTIPLPHTINDETATNIFDSEIIVSDTEAIISITETIISGGHQHASNQRIADGLHEIIICVPEAIVSVLQMIVPGKKAIISKRIPVSDGSHTIISGPDSIVGIHEAIMFVIGTIVSATKTDFSKEDTINSTLLTSVLAAEIIMSPGGILEEKFSLLVLKLLIDDVEVPAGAATSTLKVIFFEFVGKLQVRHRLFWSLAGGQRLASVLEEQTVEFAVVDEVLPLQGTGRRMAGNDGVDVFNRAHGFGNGLGLSDSTSPVVPVDQWLAPRRKNVAGMHGAQCAEHDERIAIGVGRSEIIKVDGVGSAQQSHAVLEGLVRQRVLVCWIFKDFHLLHIRLCVLVRDNFHTCRKEDVAAGVVAVSMRVDDECDRLAAHCLDLIQNRLAIVGELRVDDHDTVCREEDRGISSTAGNHIKPVRDFLDRADRPETGATTAPLSTGALSCLLRDDAAREHY